MLQQNLPTTSTSAPSTTELEQPDFPVNIFDCFRKKLTAYVLRFNPIRLSFRKLGRWIEYEAIPQAKAANQSTLTFELNDKGQLEQFRIGRQKQNLTVNVDQKVWDFLHQLGIKKLICDVRLESNQIDDVLLLLYALRQNILRFRQNQPVGKTISYLTATEGIHYACTRTRLADDTLTISYSYCVLRYSRIVRWFESRHRNFRDHRALFYAGPKYAFLIGLIATAPGIIHGFNYGNWYIFFISLIEAVIIIPIIYLFFMVVGSIEYDNEEKTYKLTRTNLQLKAYNDRIQADIQRARLIQENLMPLSSDMPLADRIDWACLYRPEEQVGGDYFDAQRLPGNQAVIIFSDVSGHGLGAAFVTAIIKTAFQSWVENPTDLADLMQALNHSLCRLIPLESFAAVFTAIYDADTRILTYINGGHHPEPLLIPTDPDRPIETLSRSRSLLLGIQEDVEFKPARQPLEAGDRILFVSDGIVEAHNIDRQIYTTERFQRWLEQHRAINFNELEQNIMKEVDQFSRDTSQSDDQTLLAMQIKN